MEHDLNCVRRHRRLDCRVARRCSRCIHHRTGRCCGRRCLCSRRPTLRFCQALRLPKLCDLCGARHGRFLVLDWPQLDLAEQQRARAVRHLPATALRIPRAETSNNAVELH